MQALVSSGFGERAIDEGSTARHVLLVVVRAVVAGFDMGRSKGWKANQSMF